MEKRSGGNVRKKDTLESVQKEYDEKMHEIIQPGISAEKKARLETWLAVLSGKLKKLKEETK